MLLLELEPALGLVIDCSAPRSSAASPTLGWLRITSRRIFAIAAAARERS